MSNTPNIRKRVRPNGKANEGPADVAAPHEKASAPDGVVYKVGYGNPPKHSQYQPGQCGNRNGRPPKSKNRKTLLDEALDRKTPVRMANGRQRIMPAFLVIMEQQIQKAMKGDTKAAAFVLDRVGFGKSGKAAGGSEDGFEVVPEAVTEAELQALNDYQLSQLLDGGYSDEQARQILAVLGGLDGSATNNAEES